MSQKVLRNIHQQYHILLSVAFATYKEWSVYRSHSLVSLFVGPVYFFVQYFIWKAVYSTHSNISGLSLDQMIIYSAIAALINYIIMDFADWNLQMLIHTGKFLTYALRPMSHVFFAFSQKVGHRILGLVFEFIPVYLIFVIVLKKWLVPAQPVWAFISISLGFIIWDIPPMDSFEMNKAIYNIPSAEYKERLKKMLDLLEVGNLVKKPTRQLSLGERMKCEFIMAMLHDPKVVFLDEPTIGLDVIAKERIRDFILDMNRKGTTFVLTTHDLGDVESMARRVIVVNSGEIVYDDSVDALRSFSGNKKLVSLSTRKPLPDLSALPGISIRNVESPYSVELELDTDLMELNRFIQNMNEHYIVNDLTMGSPKIESVIKELYRTHKK